MCDFVEKIVMKIHFDSLIDKKQIYKETALSNSQIVMLCCTPLRMSEILSITPESEVLDSLPTPDFPFHNLSKSTPRISFSEYRAMHVSKMFRTGIES